MERDSLIEVLVSAMHQTNTSLVDSTNIQSDVLIINQTNENRYYSEERDFGTVRMISTTERGLSKSRNMALKNANGKYCLICDDDERLSGDYQQIIPSAFDKYKNAGIVCFKVTRAGKKYRDKAFRVGFLRALRISSVQIAFNREKILEKKILFDERFGSGTPLGSGEENIFLYECLKKGIKIYYVPQCIGSVAQVSSQWFKGFDEQFFENRGIIIRRLMGPVMGFAYCVYFVITKRKLYGNTTPPTTAWKKILCGLRTKVREQV